MRGLAVQKIEAGKTGKPLPSDKLRCCHATSALTLRTDRISAATNTFVEWNKKRDAGKKMDETKKDLPGY